MPSFAIPKFTVLLEPLWVSAEFLLLSTGPNYFASFLRAIGNSVIPLVFLAVSAVLNIALDLWFVIGVNRALPGRRRQR